MKDINEIIILKQRNIKITNLRVIIGPKTYSLSNIVSARMHVREPKLFLPVFYLVLASVCSALVAISDLDDYSQYLKIGLYLGIGALLFFLFSTRTKYSVRLKGRVGELPILETSDRDFVERIVIAINEAIRYKDNQGSIDHFSTSPFSERSTS